MANEVRILSQPEQTLVLKDIYMSLEKLTIVGSSSELLMQIKQQVFQLNAAINAEINMKEQAAREALRDQTAALNESVGTPFNFAEKLKAKQDNHASSGNNGLPEVS